jgi:hypothetical protein
MAQTIKHIRSSVAGKVPTTADLALGVIAINTFDGKAFLKRDNGTASVVEIGAIADGAITNAKVASGAAIAGTKISPDFGSQAVVTTGTSTAASFIPTSSTAPTTGVYAPSAGSLALAAGGLARVTVDASGGVNIPTLTVDTLDALNAKVVNDAVFYDADESNYIGIKAPAVVSTNFTFTLPSGNGSNGQLLSTNSAGQLSWVSQVDISGKLDVTTAASTYQTISGMSSYLTTAAASSGYLSTTSAAATYATKGSALALAIALG